MKRVIFNQKGGVGKTSITCNLAAALAKTGKKVLVVDLDSQANSSQYLLGNDHQNRVTVSDFFASTLKLKLFKDSLKEAVHSTDFKNLFVIPADQGLIELLPKLESRYKIFKLKQSIDALIEDHEFDEVLFDTPPALNFFSMSALISADSILIPFDCDAFSAKALLQVMDTVEEVQEDHQPDLKVEGVIINHFQAQAKLPTEAIDALMAQGFEILTPYLSSSIVMRESHSKGIPLVFHKPNHKLSKEYMALAENLLRPHSEKKKPKATREQLGSERSTDIND